MKQEITFSQFCDGFPESYKENFSYEGKRALFDYLEDYEESTDETIDYDPIALCVEYTEYENLQELQANYSNIDTLEDLQDRTQYIPIKNNDGTESERFIIQDF
jgi:hypothetical protein